MRPIARGLRAEGKTLAAIAAEMNALGYRTRHGKPWTMATVSYLLCNSPDFGTSIRATPFGKITRTPPVGRGPSRPASI